jgi:hypothetical protein
MVIFTDNQLLEPQSMVCFFDFHTSVTNVSMCTQNAYVKTYNAIHEGKMVLSSKPDTNTTTGTYFQSVRGRQAKQDRTQHMVYTVHVTEKRIHVK